MKRIFLLLINFTILMVCIVWFIVHPGFDSGVAGLTALGVLLTVNIETSNSEILFSRKAILIIAIGALIIGACGVLSLTKSKTITGIKGNGNQQNKVIIE